jgi:hypothetical protein
MSAPDRLDRMEKIMSAMLETVKATKAALEPLYAVLSEQQKKVADQLIQGPMGMGRMNAMPSLLDARHDAGNEPARQAHRD